MNTALCITVLIEKLKIPSKWDNHKRDFTSTLSITCQILDMKYLSIDVTELLLPEEYVLYVMVWYTMCCMKKGSHFLFQLRAVRDNKL